MVKYYINIVVKTLTWVSELKVAVAKYNNIMTRFNDRVLRIYFNYDTRDFIRASFEENNIL